MKAPREIKRWINRLRRRYGKKNGVVYSGMLDHMDFKWATDKRERGRKEIVQAED